MSRSFLGCVESKRCDLVYTSRYILTIYYCSVQTEKNSDTGNGMAFILRALHRLNKILKCGFLNL